MNLFDTTTQWAVLLMGNIFPATKAEDAMAARKPIEERSTKGRKRPLMMEDRRGYKHSRTGRGNIDSPGLTDRHIKMLEQAWKWEWPDTAACDYAGISIEKLRYAFKTRPELKDRRDFLRDNNILTVRRNVSNSLDSGDMQTTKWYAERRITEYNPKSEIKVNQTVEMDDAAIYAALLRLAGHAKQIASTPESLQIPVSTNDNDVYDIKAVQPDDNMLTK